jgi:uncharacterized protein (DUF1501 family)
MSDLNGIDTGRRRLLGSAVAVASLGASWRLWASPSATRRPRFVVVFLRGAYDSLNALVPYTESYYHEARPHIALKAPSERGEHAVLDLDGRWGLAPALQHDLLPFYSRQELAFVPFAGTSFVSRSHFQAQDWVEFGQPTEGRIDTNSGFLNRLLLQLGAGSSGSARSGISFTQSLPPSLRGTIAVANSPVSNAMLRPVGTGYEALLQAMYQGHPAQVMVSDGMALRREISRELAEEMQSSSRDSLPARSFAIEAQRIGRLMRDNPAYHVGFVDVGGWDTHVNQGAGTGQLASRLQGLAGGLSELAAALGTEWKNTTVVVLSEFGRTFHENGSKGTDHGHGSAMWVLGGSVRGGAVRGEQAVIGPRSLHQNRDLPVVNEYRATLGGILQRMYALNPYALSAVFPGARSQDVGLL